MGKKRKREKEEPLEDEIIKKIKTEILTDSEDQDLDVTSFRNNEESLKESDDHVTQSIEENSSKKKKKKKHKRSSRDTEADNEAPVSYHWHKRKLLVEGLDEEIDEEVSDHDDKYSGLHEKFVVEKDDIDKLREEQHEWKKGRWSVQEIEILKNNVKSYMKKYSVVDIANYILSDHSRHDQFFHYAARNINRPLFYVYRKLTRTFDLENYVGKWTKRADRDLIKLHRRYGNKWTDIGRSLGTSGPACYERYRIIKKKSRKGPWSEREVERLRKAILDLRGVNWEGDSCELPPTVTWDMVANQVRTRNGANCRMKWVMLLSWKLEGGEEKWTLKDDFKLIKTLAKQEDIDDEESVDWGQLAEGWDSARNKFYLRTKWSILRRTIPNSVLMTFQDCVLYLLNNRAPAIKYELKLQKKKLKSKR